MVTIVTTEPKSCSRVLKSQSEHASHKKLLPMTENQTAETDTRPELRTERLLLRPFQLNDSEAMEAIINDRLIASNTRTIEFPYPTGAAQVWINGHAESWLAGRSVVFAICNGRIDSKIRPGELMGAIGLEIEEADQRAELGFWMGADFRGRGFCTEAARAVVEFGLQRLALNRIYAEHLLRNPASGRVLEKIGMRREGVLRRHCRKWGVFEDVAVLGILSSDLVEHSHQPSTAIS